MTDLEKLDEAVRSLDRILNWKFQHAHSGRAEVRALLLLLIDEEEAYVAKLEKELGM